MIKLWCCAWPLKWAHITIGLSFFFVFSSSSNNKIQNVFPFKIKTNNQKKNTWKNWDLGPAIAKTQ